MAATLGAPTVLVEFSSKGNMLQIWKNWTMLWHFSKSKGGNMTTRAWNALLISISTLAFAAQASAAETIETVVVTASKRAETLKNVPMSITVLGQDELTKLNARSYEDFVNNVPGMNLIETSPTHPQIVLRGINAGGWATFR
jgi:outer membrane receptor for ferrienterochelin and colicin